LFPAKAFEAAAQKDPKAKAILDGMSNKVPSHEWIHSKLRFLLFRLQTGSF